MTPVLELEKVTCRHEDGRREVVALDEVSLTAAAGELVAVMGPSGSGKSTLVHVSCGLVTPTSGAVRLDGEAVPQYVARSWWASRRRRDVGVVHQRLNLVPAITAVENVALPLELDGWSRSVAHAAALRALDEVGAAELATLGSRVLSIGEQQRVAVARAVVGERSLVLADEPTAALDSAGAEAVVRLLADLAHAGRAMVMVTHDSRLAAWADRVVVLRDGRIVDAIGGEPSDGWQRHASLSGSSGTPPVVGP